MHAASTRKARGFTLLELIIVIAILAILSVAVILVINPAETLARGRDSTRLSDLAAMKSAIGLYLTDQSNAVLGRGVNNCKDATVTTDVPEVMLSTASDGGPNQGPITDAAVTTVGFATGVGATPWSQVTLANLGSVTGTGWIPANISAITGGSPIANYPVDPVNNTVVAAGTAGCSGGSGLGAINECAQMYLYICDQTAKVFELDANLESSQFRSGGPGDKEATDGGNNTAVYETGTSLTLLGAY